MSKERGLTAYQEFVRPEDVPQDELRLVLEALIEHLNVNIVREKTPDYTAYEVWPRP